MGAGGGAVRVSDYKLRTIEGLTTPRKETWKGLVAGMGGWLLSETETTLTVITPIMSIGPVILDKGVTP